MKIELFCPTCVQEGRRAPIVLPFRDDGLYQFTCGAGHDNRIRSQAVRFQDLAEVAIQALVDGYHRDAVSTFTASLERFLEFYCRVVTWKHGVRHEPMDEAWKAVAKQSERQLGMFHAIHLMEFGQPAPVLPSRHISFRNRVTHEGYIPNEDEAIGFGQTSSASLGLCSNSFTPKFIFPASPN